jgi:hypothetical protein
MITDPNRPVTEKRLFEILSRALPSSNVLGAFEPMPAPPQVPTPIAPVTIAPPRNWDPAIARVQFHAEFNSEELSLLRRLINSVASGELSDTEIRLIEERVRK